MLDKYLPLFLREVVTVTSPQGVSRSSVIVSGTTDSKGNINIFRNRAPQGTKYPYILVGEGFDFDYGQTAGNDLLREVGHFNICICGLSYEDTVNGTTLDQIYRDTVDAMKKVRNQYLPSAIAASKMWVQCLILQNGYQFEARPVDGGEQPFLGYIVPVRAGYDP